MLHQRKQKEDTAASRAKARAFSQAWFAAGLCYPTHCHTWHVARISQVLCRWSPLFFLNPKCHLIWWGGARNWSTSLVSLIFHVIKSFTFPWMYLCMYSLLSFNTPNLFIYLFHSFFISWRLIALQYCSGFCHTLTWISRGFTCVPHPSSPSRLPLHPIPRGLPSAPALSTCLMHPAWAGDLFHHT